MKRLIAAFFLLFTPPLFAQETMKEAIQPVIDNGSYPGFVSVVADREGNLAVDCVGWADVENRIPMSDDRMFWIASMTKGITAAGLMILVDEGKVDLDAPVETYLPEFKEVKVAEEGENGVVTLRPPTVKPTVRQVMSHMSGWRFWTPQMSQFGIDVFPARKLASTAVQIPLDNDPGTHFNYSNLGIDIGSAIIEVTSGLPYHEFLQKRLFDPLGMDETVFWLTEEQNSRLARAYRLVEGRCVKDVIPQLHYPLTDRTERFAEAGGGLFSTPRDVIKFYQMLAGRGVYQGNRILSEESIQTLATKQTPEGIGENYSLGLWANGDWISHGGALGTEGRSNIATGQARVFMVQLTSSADPTIRETVERIIDER